MNPPLNLGDRIRQYPHQGRPILEIGFAKRGLLESEVLLEEYTALLRRLPKGQGARVLVNFEGAIYDPRVALFWKAQLELFSHTVEKSAVIGAGIMARTAIQGFRQTAELLKLPLGDQRARVFNDRESALDWLSR